MIARLINKLYDLIDWFRALDFLGPLALRLYLAPVFWVAGNNKLAHFEDTANWFGNPEWGLGLPQPQLLAGLAVSAEVGGAILLLVGFAVRLITVPLMVTMLVAIFAVHWGNGWQAVYDLQSPFASEHTMSLEAQPAIEAGERLERAKSILQEHGNYEWLTGRGNFLISKNGIEWAVTYFIMILALFFTGAGKLSIDQLFKMRYRPL